jgi:murein hydrolase activator
MIHRNTFRMIIRVFIITAISLLLSLLASKVIQGQNKMELQKQKDRLTEQIEETKRMIKNAEKDQKNTSAQVKILNQQIALRKELLEQLDGEIMALGEDIEMKGSEIGTLQTQTDEMKQEYAKMIYNAYKHRDSYDQLMFIFAAENFNKALKRFKMTQRYATLRKLQGQQIEQKQEVLSVSIQTIEQTRQLKTMSMERKGDELKQIEEDKRDQQSRLKSLQSKEEELRKQQKKQKADRDKLSKKIQQIISQEIEAERKRASAAEKASSTSNKASKPLDQKSGNNQGTKTLVAAPEVTLANTDFEKNKGALPWPVSAGVIVSHFGTSSHPSLEQVTVQNNGVDFSTNQGAQALAVFAGTVSSIFEIPGAGLNIIITHGSYKTVYSGLVNVSVKQGDKVSIKQTIGQIGHDGEDYTLHFEVWKVGASTGNALNPETWIKKR